MIFRLGKLLPQPKGPGVIFVFRPIDRIVRISLRTVVHDVPPQDIITRDNVSVKVNAVVYFRVIDPRRAVVEVENYMYATSQLAQTTLRSVLGQAELDDLLSERDRLNQQLQQILDNQTDPWGIKVSAVEVKHVDLPQDMQRAMARQAEAEREKRAKIIHAEGELIASEKLAQAAAVLDREPSAITLRYLQTLTEIAAEQNSTIVFPLPIELMRMLRKQRGPAVDAGCACWQTGADAYTGLHAPTAPCRARAAAVRRPRWARGATGFTVMPVLRQRDGRRLVRLTLAPGAQEQPHTHPYPMLVVVLTHGELEMHNGDVHTKGPRKSGDLEFVERGVRITAANVGTTPLEALVLADQAGPRARWHGAAGAGAAGVTRTPMLDKRRRDRHTLEFEAERARGRSHASVRSARRPDNAGAAGRPDRRHTRACAATRSARRSSSRARAARGRERGDLLVPPAGRQVQVICESICDRSRVARMRRPMSRSFSDELAQQLTA